MVKTSRPVFYSRFTINDLQKKPLHLIKRMERSLLAVSPFDGINRIRFKGSPTIAAFRFAIAD
jgi:hypothetical protein